MPITATDYLYRPWEYTSEQTNETHEGWSKHPVLRVTAKRVFVGDDGHTRSLERYSLERHGYADRGGNERYYTEEAMCAEGGDPATARFEP